ncbi:MAG: FtsK/SpoIIIE domain-containing protein [Arthrobacter sp.]
MPLHCTLVRAPGSGRTDAPLELTVQAEDGSPGSAVAVKLSLNFATRQVTVDGEPLQSLTVGRSPLVNGAVLVDGPPNRGSHSSTRGIPVGSSVFLAVQSGPAAGTILPLGRGSFWIGRTGAELTIPDPAVSRAHARIDVSDRALTITDLDSTNGTFVDDRRVRTAAISTSSLIRCGNSTMSVVVTCPQGGLGSWLGSAGKSVVEPLTVLSTSRHEPRTGLYVSAGLPLALGLGLALATGLWMFLAFTAVSAMSLLVPVFGSRRRRRELHAAVADATARDLERRRQSAPTAAELVLAHGGSRERTNAKPDGTAVWLRLGLAEQDANVSLEPVDPDFQPPALGCVPLQLDPDAHVVTVRGSGEAATGLMRFLLMQLTGYPLAQGTMIAIFGPVGSLPLTARYLPAITLHTHSADIESLLARHPATAGTSGVLMILAGHDNADGVAETALRNGWRIFDFTESGSTPGAVSIELDECSAYLRSSRTTSLFTPDFVPGDAFERYCRGFQRGGLAPAAAPRLVPDACPLGSIIDPSSPATARRWAAGRLVPGLAAPIGVGADGPMLLDVEADGPHVLIAGTTGSGKSELVRSLIAALALSFPPDSINFLFFDFKGGSGLGPLRGLPHCVGMLTDLTQSEVERTMDSLRAEIRRREMLLSAAHVSDLEAYHRSGAGGSVALPRLLLVIDEFRVLLDDAPEALRELMRIATIGRSLGVHLVMATQRPQGALNADIRANVTTSIALRVQSDHESRDIIGTSAAAAIDVTAPGRAYLSRGSRRPEEFQSALLSFPSPQSARINVRRTIDTLGMPERPATSTATPAAAAALLVRTLTPLWVDQGHGALLHPVAAPLPNVPTCPRAGVASLSARSTDGRTDAGSPVVSSAWGCERCGGEDSCIDLGWLDLPAEQRVVGLFWHPGRDGHLALIGGGAMEDATRAMSLVVDQLSQHPAESHLYVLDAHGCLAGRSFSGRAGALVGLHELRRGVRVLERLCGEMSRRLSHAAEAATPLVLVIAGWGSWASALRSGPLFWAEDLVHNLIRDGHNAGIAVLISGGPELASSKFLSAVPNRAYFPKGTNGESRLAWPSMPLVPPVSGRAVAVGPLAGENSAVCQFHASADGPNDSDQLTSPGRPPFRIDPLPAVLPAERLRALINLPTSPSAPRGRGEAVSPTPGTRTLYIGVGGDEISPVTVSLPPGGVLAVLGSPDSGKSAFLAALAQLNPAITWQAPWLAAGPGNAPHPNLRPTGAELAEFWSDVCRGAVKGRLDDDAVLLVDDADRLPASVNQQLLEANSIGWTVVFSAGFGPALIQRVPLAMTARTNGLGILVAPRSALDGDLFGQRFELDPHPPPGRAVLLTGGTAKPVQLAFP